jgi:hypothetical protein
MGTAGLVSSHARSLSYMGLLHYYYLHFLFLSLPALTYIRYRYPLHSYNCRFMLEIRNGDKTLLRRATRATHFVLSSSG